MIGTILVAVVAGVIIGALARLILPGKQNIGMLMTILLGAVGALLGAGISAMLFDTGDKIFSPIPFIIGLVVAIILVAIYAGVSGRSTRTPRA